MQSNDIPEWVKPLKEAEVKLETHMLFINIENGYSWLSCARILQYPDIMSSIVPDVRDWNTFMMCLKQLAERIGLGHTEGLRWYSSFNPEEWILAGDKFEVCFFGNDKTEDMNGFYHVPNIKTTDQYLALALALRATK